MFCSLPIHSLALYEHYLSVYEKQVGYANVITFRLNDHSFPMLIDEEPFLFCWL